MEAVNQWTCWTSEKKTAGIGEGLNDFLGLFSTPETLYTRTYASSVELSVHLNFDTKHAPQQAMATLGLPPIAPSFLTNPTPHL